MLVIAAVQQPRSHSSPHHLVVSGILISIIVTSSCSSGREVETASSVQAVQRINADQLGAFHRLRVAIARRVVRHVMMPVVTWTVVIATMYR